MSSLVIVSCIDITIYGYNEAILDVFWISL